MRIDRGRSRILRCGHYPCVWSDFFLESSTGRIVDQQRRIGGATAESERVLQTCGSCLENQYQNRLKGVDQCTVCVCLQGTVCLKLSVYFFGDPCVWDQRTFFAFCLFGMSSFLLRQPDVWRMAGLRLKQRCWVVWTA